MLNAEAKKIISLMHVIQFYNLIQTNEALLIPAQNMKDVTPAQKECFTPVLRPPSTVKEPVQHQHTKERTKAPFSLLHGISLLQTVQKTRQPIVTPL